VPATVFLLVLFGWPVVNVLKQSLFDHGFTVREYTRAFEPAYRRILLHTIEIALSAAGLSLLFGYPTAYVMARVRPRVRVVMVLVVGAAYLSNPLAPTTRGSSCSAPAASSTTRCSGSASSTSRWI
jgi:ABC-type spermidine/putrescine transport system permease subunit I